MLNTLLDSLPQGFDFYHLGRIELLSSESAATLPTSSDDRLAVAFSIEGEARALLVLQLEDGLDASMYSEAGNIIGSRLVSRLAQVHGLECTLSPPRVLKKSQLREVLAQAGTQDGTHLAKRSYLHRQGGRTVAFHALLLSLSKYSVGGQSPSSTLAATEGAGNA